MDYSRGVLKAMTSPFFPDLRRNLGPFLIDKTDLIENIVINNWSADVDLVLRPRRCGKSTMLQMLNSFFSIRREGDPDPLQLFEGLRIASKKDICTEHMGKYPVIFCDFKNLSAFSWEGMLSNFKDLVSDLYMKWEDCLLQSLSPVDKTYFESICLKTATVDELANSLYRLSKFLTGKFGRKVIVLIDEYEAPINCAFENDYFNEPNVFFGRHVLPRLLKSNEALQYAALAGVTPTAKSGWYSGLNNVEVHALHTRGSIFAGMLMFTEDEVENLRKLSNSELELEDLRTHYNSYVAAGHIRVYNPVSVMSALKKSSIENFWIATGEYPLLKREFPYDGLGFFEKLLAGKEIDFPLAESVTFNDPTLNTIGTLTLLCYAGYLTKTIDDGFKIPNREVMTDWARWIVDDAVNDATVTSGNILGILKTCVEGPVSDFEAKWPNFMQQVLHPKLVSKDRTKGNSHKTPENIYHVFFLGLMQSLGPHGWEVIAEDRAGVGYADLRLLHKKTSKAVVIELKSSKLQKHMEGDVDEALEQIIQKNYRNPEGLPGINTLREYGIAAYHLNSCVKGRYLELDDYQWVEKPDPVMSVL